MPQHLVITDWYPTAWKVPTVPQDIARLDLKTGVMEPVGLLVAVKVVAKRRRPGYAPEHCLRLTIDQSVAVGAAS